MDKELELEINEMLKYFDKWTLSIGLPNDKKPLKNITPEEYKNSLENFYNTLDLDISFRYWVESFYNKNEIDFDYLYLMSWENWFKLYLKVFAKYINEDKIKFN